MLDPSLLGLGCQEAHLRGIVSRCVGKEITERTFCRWRSTLGLTKGRDAFYKPDEIEILVEFGKLVVIGITYNQAHEIIYSKYKGQNNG